MPKQETVSGQHPDGPACVSLGVSRPLPATEAVRLGYIIFYPDRLKDLSTERANQLIDESLADLKIYIQEAIAGQ